MKNWYMVTLVGRDQKGIVSQVTKALFDGGCNLGEASMMRLGSNFGVMLMVGSDSAVNTIESLIQPVAKSLGLMVHIDAVDGDKRDHPQPNVDISVYGADKAGIVAEVTGLLAEVGLNIIDMQTVVAGSEERPIYIMQIDGHSDESVDRLREVIEPVVAQGIEVQINDIETMIG
ncbi:MAG: ACT domain-containing protein [Gammaproteobacteria bacterium]|nr:ACT domain-containing protein [Gammaproteobacteria bacterium]